MCLTPYVQPRREHTYHSVLNRAKIPVLGGGRAERRLLALLEDGRRAVEDQLDPARAKVAPVLDGGYMEADERSCVSTLC